VKPTCIVVPCYNEATRFDRSAFESFLALGNDVRFVLVNDGSSDGTLRVLQQLAQRHPDRVEVLDLENNQGKAEAVRQGMLRALRGGECEFVGYWDADLATPLSAIGDLAEVLERRLDVDIVFGTRVALLGRAIGRKPWRHYLGRFFATGASIVLSLPVYDTQCGAKLFRRGERSAALFARPFGSRWIFDVEIVARHLQQMPGWVGIYEQPLDQWKDIGESKVRPSDFLRAIGELAHIYRTYRSPRSRSFVLDLLTSRIASCLLAGAAYAALQCLVLIWGIGRGWSPTASAVLGAVAAALIAALVHARIQATRGLFGSRALRAFLAVATPSIALSYGAAKLAEGLSISFIGAQIAASMLAAALGLGVDRLMTRRSLQGASSTSTQSAAPAALLPGTEND
jgi:glycosyltransferase involved in cell wall biosynthesis